MREQIILLTKKEVEEANRIRKQNGMKAIEIKYRECLNCGRSFKSTQNSHRLCKLCKMMFSK